LDVILVSSTANQAQLTPHYRISKHPDVNFTVVINPGSGPGPDPLPDANYTREIPKLASYENVRLLGYVATTYAKRNISLVRKDIETYAAWPANSSNPDLAVRGIFFDETPQQYDEEALVYLQELTDVVKNTPGLGPDHFVCLPLLFPLGYITSCIVYCIFSFPFLCLPRLPPSSGAIELIAWVRPKDMLFLLQPNLSSHSLFTANQCAGL
jgi:hypothetical protein